MKQALRRGTYSTLNIWFQTNLTATNDPKAPVRLLGYCTTPTNVTYEYNGNLFDYPASAYAIDGCNVYTGTVPGSPSVVYGYNRGLTAAHEVGHWMGLLHTFEVSAVMGFGGSKDNERSLILWVQKGLYM